VLLKWISSVAYEVCGDKVSSFSFASKKRTDNTYRVFPDVPCLRYIQFVKGLHKFAKVEMREGK
jgi:hypothetical protein